MKKQYYIQTSDGASIGPFKQKIDADAQLNQYENASVVELYQLSKKEKRLRCAPKGLVLLPIILLVFLLALNIMGSSYSNEISASQAENWVPKPAILEIHSVNDASLLGINNYKIYGEFIYEYKGSKYTSFEMGSYSNDDVRSLLDIKNNISNWAMPHELDGGGLYPLRQKVTCYVNPDNPEKAVLFRNKYVFNMYYVPMIFISIMFIIMILSYRKYKFLKKLDDSQIL